MRRLSKSRFALLSILAGCSQPVSGGGGASPVPAPSVAAVIPVPSAPVTATPCDDARDFTVPREAFTDARRNFDAVRKTLLEDYYRDSLTEDDMYRAATAGMLERVDPDMHKWNKLLSPTEIAELRRDLQGELVGIGVKIDLDPATGYIDVKGTIAGSPAERAGIAPPDKIVTVDGRLYRGLTVHDVVADIRGKAGESVTLSVLRGPEIVTVPVVRDKVAYDVVRDMVVGGDVGYVRIPSFNAKTPALLRDALSDLAQKSVRSLLIDVRHNPGGSFDDAVEAAGEMVPAGSTVVSLNRRGKTEPVVAKSTPVLLDLPVAVLVDSDTSSSAELMTAALRDLRHATVVGTHTHGKWTVQKLEELPNGYAVKYTMAVFASPAGQSYEGAGLTPDVEVDAPPEQVERVEAITDATKRVAEDVQLRTALSVLSRR